MKKFLHNFIMNTRSMQVIIRDRTVLDQSGELVEFYQEQIAKGVIYWDLDLREMDTLRSATIGMLVGLNDTLTSRGGKLRLIMLKNSKLTNVIKLSRLDRIINVVMA